MCMCVHACMCMLPDSQASAGLTRFNDGETDAVEAAHCVDTVAVAAARVRRRVTLVDVCNTRVKLR